MARKIPQKIRSRCRVCKKEIWIEYVTSHYLKRRPFGDDYEELFNVMFKIPKHNRSLFKSCEASGRLIRRRMSIVEDDLGFIHASFIKRKINRRRSPRHRHPPPPYYSHKPRTPRKRIIRNVTIFALIIILIGGVYHHRAFVILTLSKFIGYETPEIGPTVTPSPIITPVQTPSVTPTSTPTITSQPNITDIEVAIFIYTNIERRNHGVKELIWDEKLSEIARAHSRDMVQNDFFSHINLRGEGPTARAKRYGYPLYKELGDGWYREGIAENIGKMPTGNVLGVGYVSNDADSIAKAQVESWMSSSGHRRNILDPSYDRLGVGVAYDGLYYISTQNFW